MDKKQLVEKVKELGCTVEINHEDGRRYKTVHIIAPMGKNFGGNHELANGSRKNHRKHDPKWKCRHCDGIFLEKDSITAVNLLGKAEEISRCPICKSVVGFIRICDERGCRREADFDYTTPEGHRYTCGIHMKPPHINARR